MLTISVETAVPAEVGGLHYASCYRTAAATLSFVTILVMCKTRNETFD